ncbi:MAG: hypothetical protein J7K00_03545 [Candidatus Diapherotrites archaeon]|nr:hypothetical protein [Candidatus Diapherotrites archaeon]
MERRAKPKVVQDIARQRIEILFDLSKQELEAHPKRAARYIEIARKISSKYNERLTKKQKQSFCKKCNTPIIPGKNATVRIVSKPKKHLLITCGSCGAVKKHFLDKIEKPSKTIREKSRNEGA